MTKGLAFHFDPTTEIPSQRGKILFITGATSGLGREALFNLVAHDPERIYFTGRSQASADKLLQDVHAKHPSAQVHFIKMDLASIESVKAGAAEFFRREARLDLLMANAGVMALPPGLTTDGYEVQFGTNHVGHSALITLLLPTLALTAEQGFDTRIVILSSDMFKLMSSTIDLAHMHTTQAHRRPLAAQHRYGESKLANLLYARELARRYPTITTVALHPGVGKTGLQDNFSAGAKLMGRVSSLVMPIMTAEQTAWNQTWAATAPLGTGARQVRSGVYYEPVGVESKLPAHGRNDALAGELWEWTAKELAKFGIN